MTYRKIQQENHKQRLFGEVYSPTRSRIFNLVDHLQGDGERTRGISYAELARLTNMSDRTAKRAVAELEADGQLMVHNNKDWIDGLYLNIANTYSIVKKTFLSLKQMVMAKALRDQARAKRIAALGAVTRKRDLSDNAVLSSTNPKDIKQSSTQEYFTVSQQLSLSLRSKGWT